MNDTRFASMVLFAALWAAPLAWAQGYTPDLAEFDGTNHIAVLPDPQLAIRETGTIEFWVSPGWKSDPGYDPVILSNAGPDGVSYLVALLRDKDGIGVVAGDASEIAAFDFSDDKMHHVAINDYGDTLLIHVDGELIGRFEGMSFEDLPSSGLWIGSADGESAPFIGAIAGLRLWSYAVERETLIAYAMAEVFIDETAFHPAIEHLMGISDFANRDFLIADADAGEAQ